MLHYAVSGPMWRQFGSHGQPLICSFPARRGRIPSPLLLASSRSRLDITISPFKVHSGKAGRLQCFQFCITACNGIIGAIYDMWTVTITMGVPPLASSLLDLSPSIHLLSAHVPYILILFSILID